MANEQLAQNYAQAIFEQATADWLTPLKQVAQSLKPADVEALDDPGLEFAKKQDLLQRSVSPGTPVEVRNLLALLASRNQMYLLPNVVSEFDRYSRKNVLRDVARVTSAVALNDNEKRQLESKLRGLYGADIDIEYLVDQSILGGVIVRLGDKVIDGSVSGRLAALREKLK